MNPDATPERTRWEWLAVALITLIGAWLRSWPLGRLGLTHFDEGIYALVASWSLHPRGLSALDPTLISYAPPGFPILGGLAYAVLGRSDSALILVSQIAGTLTIPVVAWLARRTFGPGAGFASAVFCAWSGPHIAFSRMALTDVSSLLVWLLALGAGQRFLERPGFRRSLVMGLAVGLAQEFKYNGYLTGAIVVGSAGLGLLIRPGDRKLGSSGKTFGWGIVAAGVAWLVVWPWYAFVEAHGGYAALLRHQRSYLGGFRAWWPNFLIQCDQAVALSGGARLIWPALILGYPTIAIARSWVAATAQDSRIARLFWLIGFGLAPGLFITGPYHLGLILAPWLLTRPDPARRLVGVWWLVLSVLTPFYHPYARLWLPYHAANWLLMGWLVADGLATIRAGQIGWRSNPRQFRVASLGFLGLFGIGLAVWFLTDIVREARPQTDLLAPSDSLRRASLEVSALLPDEVQGLQLLVRPPVTFTLAGRIALLPLPGSAPLLKPGNPRVWALVDSAILRSEVGQASARSDRELIDRFSTYWEVVEEIPTTLTLPTLLDINPASARSSSTDRNCPLWLLRPRRSGAFR